MPTFHFIGRDAKGAAIDGTLEAASEGDVAALLLARQVTPTSIRPGIAGKGGASSLFGGRKSIGLKGLLRISKRLHYLLRAGMELSRALRLLESQERTKPVAAFLTHLRQQVQAGKSLTGALASTNQKIPQHLIGILYAGENAGSLDQSFQSITLLLERRLALQNKLVSALIYPAILFVAAILTIVLLSTTVIPRFQPIFDQAGAKLPDITRLVMGIAEFVRSGWLPSLAIGAAAAAGFAYAARQEGGKRRLHAFVLRIPLMGELLTKAAYGQLAHAWSIQLSSGVTVTQAMRQGLGGIANVQIRASISQALERIVAGKTLANALAQDRAIPILFREFVELGEHTGRLPETLSELAKIYDAEIEQDVQRCMTLITPIATLVLGGMVALVLAALMSAVMAVNDLAM
jgi:general secretion pathway protein F